MGDGTKYEPATGDDVIRLLNAGYKKSDLHLGLTKEHVTRMLAARSVEAVEGPSGSYWNLRGTEAAIGVLFSLFLCVALDGKQILEVLDHSDYWSYPAVGAFIRAFSYHMTGTIVLGTIGLIMGASTATVLLNQKCRAGYAVRSGILAAFLVVATVLSELNKHWNEVETEEAVTTAVTVSILLIAAIAVTTTACGRRRGV